MTQDSMMDLEVLPKVYSVAEREKYLTTPFVVQVINLRHYDEKTRVILYDGKYNMHGLLDKSLVNKLESQGFQKSCLLKILKHSCFDNEKFYTMIHEAEVASAKYDTEAHETIKIAEYFSQHPEQNYFKNGPGAKEGTSATSAAPAPTSDNYQRPNASANAGKPGRPVNAIEMLSPYQNSWTIKARVSYKGDLRTWQNARGQGKLFNVNFLDESDEIRATAFNEVAERMYETLQEGKVYYVSKARVNAAKPQFSRLSHPYELSLDRDTMIEECFDNTDNVPKLNFNFTKLSQVQKAEPNTVIDVIGVLREVKPAFQITAKSTGKPFDRRDIAIVDDSNFSITVGLWNATALDFNVSEGTVLAFKGCKVQDFGGRSLTLTQAGSIMPNPDAPEAYQLKGWYDNQGMNETFQTLKVEGGNSTNYIKNRKTILQAQEENLGVHEQPDFFNIKATVNFFKTDTFSYPACTNELKNSQFNNPTTCNRKIIDQNDGTWRCERCDINYNEPYYRYILNCSVMDATGQLWTTLFDSDATKLFEVPAGELLRLKEENEADFKAIIDKVTMQEYNFRIKARQDSFNDTTRIRYQTLNIFNVDFAAECEYLTNELDALL